MESVSIVRFSNPECGFGSTEVVHWVPGKDKIYWHKGKGILSCMILKEDKEDEYADTITGKKS